MLGHHALQSNHFMLRNQLSDMQASAEQIHYAYTLLGNILSLSKDLISASLIAVSKTCFRISALFNNFEISAAKNCMGIKIVQLSVLFNHHSHY